MENNKLTMAERVHVIKEKRQALKDFLEEEGIDILITHNGDDQYSDVRIRHTFSDGQVYDIFSDETDDADDHYDRVVYLTVNHNSL